MTSSRSTVGDRRILASASASRTLLSSCRGVAVITCTRVGPLPMRVLVAGVGNHALVQHADSTARCTSSEVAADTSCSWEAATDLA